MRDVHPLRHRIAYGAIRGSQFVGSNEPKIASSNRQVKRRVDPNGSQKIEKKSKSAFFP